MMLFLLMFIIKIMNIEVFEHPKDRRLRFVYGGKVYMITTDEYLCDSRIAESIVRVDELEYGWKDCGYLK